MPAQSQDQWTEKLTIRKDTLAGLDFNRNDKLSFTVDAFGTHSEQDEDDNTLKMDRVLRASKSDCGAEIDYSLEGKALTLWFDRVIDRVIKP